FCFIIIPLPFLWDVWFHPLLIRQQSHSIRGYTGKVRGGGLRKIAGLKPTQVGFACVDAVSNRPFNIALLTMRPNERTVLHPKTNYTEGKTDDYHT
ncbi:hypothetical protein, partial [Nostoc sp.]|uniref:hypothetical protein n=1 Tax=Nostoc sp. TaxID=1180 RepID=UPI002FF6E289